MEKHEITLSFDRERMDALTFYLKEENATVQGKMDEALRQLYEKSVPEPVREYLDATAAPPKPRRPSRPAPKPKAEQKEKAEDPVPPAGAVM